MNQPKPKPKKQPPKPQKPSGGEIIWMACRAKQGCTGQQARVVFKQKQPGGGIAARYRCLTCGGSFHINT